jgi:hypothetical protein
MHKRLIFSFCKAALTLLLSTAVSTSFGQSWMEGYNYRKSIEVQKAKVPGTASLVDFPVLVTFTDPDLRYIPGLCAVNKISSSKGLDISFALASAPADAVPFQMEHFDPATGTLTCWVRLSSVSAAGSVSEKTMFYLYYGSNLIHDPHGSNAVATWPPGMFRRWHMNLDVQPASAINAKSRLADGLLVGSSNMTAANFVPGKVGTAVQLNGSSEFLSAARDTSRNFTISFWVRFDRVDREQVILTNDSTGLGGYTVKINASGRLMLDTKSGSIPLSLTAATAALPNVWYFVSVIGDGRRRGIYINGKTSSSITRIQAIGQGGTIIVGRSKQKTSYFGGRIDELSIEVGIRSLEWMESEYNNQHEPSQFYSVGSEQRTEVITPTGYVFNGTINNRWAEGGNWNLLTVPEAYANVTVKAGVQLRISDAGNILVSQLRIDSAASITLTQALEVICGTTIAADGILKLEGPARLQLNGDLINDGSIRSEDSGGTLAFSGHGAGLNVSGTGSIGIAHLQVDLGAANGSVNIHQPVVVTGTVRVLSGVLNADGKVTLAATRERTAAVSTIENLAGATVTGLVKVEKYVSGSFAAPATGRGWRLWSSPVYADMVNGAETYRLAAVQKSLFVTGKGGVANGFDSSPQNGNTIYTHDQSIVGTLSQKYVAISNIAAGVPLGKGIYVYSRGWRDAPDAYRDQIQVAPFRNPEPYTITYSGHLFIGDLKVDVYSRNQGESGDGFNLLGNPYASPIRWGSLKKENIGPFAWMFNPVNGAYDVTDDPDLLIPAAEGFFVKVNSGAANGSLTFDEHAKASEEALSRSEEPASFSSLSSVPPAARISSSQSAAITEPLRKLEVVLSSGIFSQKYVLKLHNQFSDASTDEDAVTVGEGFVNVAGLGANDEKLGIDSRELPMEEKPVRMFVKVWATGRYRLDFSGMSSFLPRFSVALLDDLLKTATPITAAGTPYSFDVDLNVPESQGAGRFTILIKPEPISAVDKDAGDPVRMYPNPFTDVLTLKAADRFPEKVRVRICDLLGHVVLTMDFVGKEGRDSLTMDTSALKSGLYIIEIVDGQNNKRIKTAKIVKP